MSMKINFLPNITTLTSKIRNVGNNLRRSFVTEKDTFEKFKPIEYQKCFDFADIHIFTALNFPKTFLDIRKVSVGNEILNTMCDLHNKTKGKIEFPMIIKTFKNKSSRFAGDYVNEIIRLNASDNGLRSTLIHELAHYNHEIVYENYLKMGKKSELIADGVTDFSFYDEFNNDNAALKLIKKHLGGYATSSPCEFVACAFTAAMNGKKLPVEIWNLYNKYSGPLAAEIKPMFIK